MYIIIINTAAFAVLVVVVATAADASLPAHLSFSSFVTTKLPKKEWRLGLWGGGAFTRYTINSDSVVTLNFGGISMVQLFLLLVNKHY